MAAAFPFATTVPRQARAINPPPRDKVAITQVKIAHTAPYERILIVRRREGMPRGMTHVLAQKIALQDRARLRERFFGAARTVLARL